MKERISREDIVRLYNIEITFFNDLASSGLIQTEEINNTTYLHYDQLSAFERFTNWHYDLEVNMAGLEIIHRLLQQIEELRGVKFELGKITQGIFFFFLFFFWELYPLPVALSKEAPEGKLIVGIP